MRGDLKVFNTEHKNNAIHKGLTEDWVHNDIVALYLKVMLPAGTCRVCKETLETLCRSPPRREMDKSYRENQRRPSQHINIISSQSRFSDVLITYCVKIPTLVSLLLKPTSCFPQIKPPNGLKVNLKKRNKY